MNRIHSALVVLVCFLNSLECAYTVDPARWCTVSSLEQQKCEDMKTAFTAESLTPTIACVNTASKEECLSRIAGDRADLMTLDGGEVYTGGRKYKILPIMEEVYAGGATGYYATPIVRKSNPDVTFKNLEGKTSCHTGYGRSAGWNIPVGTLLEEGYMAAVDCQDSLQSASAFFNLSCVPGALDAAPAGADVSNLCALCNDSSVCSRSEDAYSSYEGAFRCLVEQNADVAFIKPVTVMDNTDGNNQEEWAKLLQSADFEILCRDGSRAPITADETCHTAKSPSHALVTSADKSQEDINSYVKLMNDAVGLFAVDDNAKGFSLFDSDEYTSGRDLLFKDSAEGLNELDVEDYVDYLGEEYIGSIDGLKACPDGTLRFCTISDQEQQKCQAMSNAFKTSSITPAISCYQQNSHEDCMVDIKGGNADLVTLDSGDIYRAGKYYDLVPVMSESYDGSSGDVSYWAVAVVKSDSSFNINDLKGKKSCHTGIMKTSGWIVPVGYLVNAGEITIDDCNVPGAMGDYFTQSCVPGALQDQYNPDGTNPDNLCELCSGVGGDFCVRNDHEPYYDYSGSFRCLVEGGGDVAFIKHLTVDETIDNAQSGQWAFGLNKGDYTYLCPDGTKQVNWDEECSLSKVSAHALMTSTNAVMADIVNVFTQGQTAYGNDNSNTFKLFDSADYAGNDLLFKDSTNTLQSVGNKNTYELYLTEEFVDGMEALDPETCGSAANGMAFLLLSAMMVIAHVIFGGGA